MYAIVPAWTQTNHSCPQSAVVRDLDHSLVAAAVAADLRTERKKKRQQMQTTVARGVRSCCLDPLLPMPYHQPEMELGAARKPIDRARECVPSWNDDDGGYADVDAEMAARFPQAGHLQRQAREEPRTTVSEGRLTPRAASASQAPQLGSCL